MSTTPKPSPDVLIIGGGIIGAACAHALVGTGRRVVIIDQSHPGAATPASAGMLAPMVEATPDDPAVGAAVRGRDLSWEVARQLEEATGISIDLQATGIYQVRFSEAEVEEAKARIAWQRQQGYPTEWLSAEEVRERLPGLGPHIAGAAFAPEDGSLNPRRLQQALLASAERRGARIRRGERAKELLIHGDRIVGVRTTRAPSRGVAAGAVVIAAGSWSGTLQGLPRPIPVEPVRGQMLSFPWPPDVPKAVVFATRGYVVHRGGEALVGSTMEHVGFDHGVTDSGRAGLRGLASRIFPALASLDEDRSWAGLRPVSSDGHPLIGPDPEVDGLWYATGHGRNGILFGVLTGHMVRQLMDEKPLPDNLEVLHTKRVWPAR